MSCKIPCILASDPGFGGGGLAALQGDLKSSYGGASECYYTYNLYLVLSPCDQLHQKKQFRQCQRTHADKARHLGKQLLTLLYTRLRRLRNNRVALLV